MSASRQPFPKTWWVVEGKLLAGCFPGTPEPGGVEQRLRSLIDAGIRTFVSLQPADERNSRTREPFPDYEPVLRRMWRTTEPDLFFHRFPIADQTAPGPELTIQVLDAIDEALADDRPVYVHCWGGHGRTGTIVACWLVRHGASADAAVRKLRELRSRHPELAGEAAPQTEDQRDLVNRWATLDPALSVGDRSRDGGALGGARRSEAAAAGSRAPNGNLASPLLIEVEPLGLHDRYLGAMFGLAVGDAVGTTLEFKPRGTFAPITDMVGGGPFDLEKGQWTDDTSMALCLAESLVHCRGSDPDDQMRRYVDWWQHGHLSSTGRCFDIGNTTRAALGRFLATGDPIAGSEDPQAAGNGSLMRLAPVPLAFRTDLVKAVEAAALSSRTTHGAAEAVDACRFMTVLMVRALAGAPKAELLRDGLWERSLGVRAEPLAGKVRAVAQGSYKKTAAQVRGSGYVVDSLEAALWAFHHHEDYAQAVLAAANLGDDADTTAAVCGQLAGAAYGLSGIPTAWADAIALRDTVAELARGLLVLSGGGD